MSSKSSIAVGVVVSVWALLGAVDVLVWIPQALAPSTPLGSVYAAIGELGDTGWVVPWPVLAFGAGLVAAVILTRRTSRLRRAAPSTRAGVVLVVIAALTFVWLWSGLPMQLWLSNHLPPYEGGMSRFGAVYGWIGIGAAGAALVALGMTVRARTLSARRAATPS